jgi:hypothetical protein
MSANIVDLGSILGEETKPVTAAISDLSEDEIRAKYNRSDFDNTTGTDSLFEALEDAIPETPGDDFYQDGEEPKTPGNPFELPAYDDYEEEPEKPPRTKEFYARRAERAVRIFDKGLRALTRFGYKKKILERGDEQALDDHEIEFDLNSKQGVIDMDAPADLKAVLGRYKRLERAYKDVPLSGDETDDLVHDLTEILETRQASLLSPETSLLITVGFVIISRMEPIFFNSIKQNDDEIFSN